MEVEIFTDILPADGGVGSAAGGTLRLVERPLSICSREDQTVATVANSVVVALILYAVAEGGEVAVIVIV